MKSLDSAFGRPVVLDSSPIAHVAYDDHGQHLHIEFRDGSAYIYHGVPRPVYDELLRAHSQGAYFNKNIRSGYAHWLVGR